MQPTRHAPSITLTFVLGVAALAIAGEARAAAPPPPPVDGSEYVIPEIPLDRIEFRGTGYPLIPADVQELITQREDVWHRMSQDALRRAMPEIERWEKLGKPFVRVARQAVRPAASARSPRSPAPRAAGCTRIGGRGGRVFVVTTLADHGPGSFREACEAGGPRMVVFNVAGIIRLERPLDILAPYITIAGQTAPGDGVCVAGHSVHLRTHDVVIRYMRFRRGITDISNRDDTLSGDAIGNVIIDHCSASWGNDETLSIYRQMYAKDPSKPREREKLPTVNNTIQWTIISESLDTYHHGFGATWGGANAGVPPQPLRLQHRPKPEHLVARLHLRQQRAVQLASPHAGRRGADGQRHQQLLQAGAEDRGRAALPHRQAGGRRVVRLGQLRRRERNRHEGQLGRRDPARQRRARHSRQALDEPGPMPHITIQPAEEAYASVLEHVGATLPKRDAVDERVIEMVRTGKVTYEEGKGIITDIRQVGGFPKYEGEPLPVSAQRRHPGRVEAQVQARPQ